MSTSTIIARMAKAIPAPMGWAMPDQAPLLFSHQPAKKSQMAGTRRNHKPWFAMKVATVSDKVTGGEATESELTKM